MSITNWINKILGIDDSRTSFDVPSEYKLPTKNTDVNMHSGRNDFFKVDQPVNNYDVNMHHFGHNDFFEDTDSFEDNLNKLFNSSFEEILKQFETEFLNNNENINNSNIFIVPINAENDIYNQSPNEKEHNTSNKIPKKNFMARNYFLKKCLVPKTLDEPPIRVTVSPALNSGQSSTGYHRSTTRTFMSGTFDNRIIEKETTTKQLQDGITEKVIVMKDGNQKCITTITENLKTGEQNCNKNLVNLNESQLNEFENRFSKFR